MVIHNILSQLFSAKSSVEVLRQLNQRVVGLTGREAARLAEITPQAAHNALANLEALNLVKREYAGNSHLFKINRKSYLYKNIISLVFEAERNMQASIFSEIKKAIGKNAESVIIFGSVARNSETIDSDLDICFVYNKSKKKAEISINKLRDKLNDEFGVTLSPFYITKAEFKKRVKSAKPPIRDIIKDGIVIAGKSMEALIHG